MALTLPPAVMLAFAWSASARAQVILPPLPPTGPPWNVLTVFEPVPFAQTWELATRNGLAPEDTPVRTRQHPGYEQVGVRAGSWMFYPALTLGTVFDSNVFASNTDRRSDLTLVVHPSLRVNTLWERHEVALQADVWSGFYRLNPGLDYTDASIRARGRIDVAHDAVILTNVRAARLHDEVGSLSSPVAAVQPTPYDLFTADIAYRKQFNRLTGSIGARFASYDYGTTRARDGSIINQDSRDGQIYSLYGRLDYVVSPMLGLFTAVDVNRRDLQGTPTRAASSDGYRVLTGVNFELTRLISGEIGVGYARQRFDSAAIGTIEGPAYRAMLVWSPTRTVDVKLKAETIVTQATETDTSGVRADAVQLGIDYEFRRNVIFSIAGTYERDTFFGQTRRDTVLASTAELKYLLNRFSSVGLRHRYISRDSNLPLFVYDKQEVGINVTVQY